MLLAVCHSAEKGWTRVEDLDLISDLRVRDDLLLWVEGVLGDLDESDVALISEEFGLHPLAVEDALDTRQRPKFEAFEHHFFLVLDQLDEQSGQLEATQISCFVGRRYVLTLHDGAERTLREAKRRWEEHEADARLGPSFLVHALLDAIVDDYQDIADRLENEVEELEDIVLEATGAPIESRLYSLKQQISRLRRYATPVGRELGRVIQNDSGYLTTDTAAYFRDVHDHTLRMSDQIRSIDDLSQAVLELRKGEQATALNEVTKRLTGWAAIIAVPTFIASVYGMNFELVPHEGRIFGFWFAVALMAAAGLTLYFYFKKKGWI
jgi:magnesium transporter